MKIVFLGDSLTEGYGLSEQNCAWVNIISKEMKCEIINEGISGDTTLGMLSRLINIIEKYSPKYVFIMGGTNDLNFNMPNNFIFANINSITRILKKYNVEAIIGIPTKMIGDGKTIEGDYLKELINQYSINLREFLENDGLSYIDFFKLSQDFGDSDYLDDGLHPNEKGHKKMADYFLKNLEAVIGEYNK